MHSKAEAIADIARQHDVLLFDFAIGPDALERTLAALRTSPLGASIAIFVPQQTALPPAVVLAGQRLRHRDDLAATCWWPRCATRRGRRGSRVDGQARRDAPRADVFWKAFDALPVPVLVVDAAGTILHANAACTKLADGAELVEPATGVFFVAEDGPASPD